MLKKQRKWLLKAANQVIFTAKFPFFAQYITLNNAYSVYQSAIIQHTLRSNSVCSYSPPANSICYYFRSSPIISMSFEMSTGFAICPFIPEARAFCLSSEKAFAVMAIIGICAFSFSSKERII